MTKSSQSEEDPIETIKQTIYDLMDLANLDGINDPEAPYYSENTMSFLKSIEEKLDRLAP